MIPRPWYEFTNRLAHNSAQVADWNFGVLLLLGSLAGFAYTGNSAWKLWQQTHPKAVSGKAAPAGTNAIRAGQGTNAVRVPLGRTQPQWPLPNRWRPKSRRCLRQIGRVFMGEIIAFSLAIRLLQMDGKSRLLPLSTIAAPKSLRRASTGAGSPAMCLLVGPETRRLWTFGAGKNGSI